MDSIGFLQEAEEAIQELSGKLGSLVQSITAKVVESITKAGNQVVNFTMAMVIAFYLLKDKAGFISLTNRLFKIFYPIEFLKVENNFERLTMSYQDTHKRAINGFTYYGHIDRNKRCHHWN